MLRLFVMLQVLFLTALSAQAARSLPPDNPKYQAVQRIYDNVGRAFGNGRMPPRLFVTPVGADNRHAIAWSNPGTEGAIGIESESAPLQEGFIAIDERVYDLFASLGEERDSALAFLLGHELTHYYMRHGWVGDFGNSFASLDMGKKMLKVASYEEVIKRETEADYFGGFYGYIAGYDTLGIAGRALDLIYAEYRLPDRLPDYPSRPERRAIAERADGNLKKLVPVFNAANRLLLLGRYSEAARLFEHLGHNFPSREMFNNAGVAYSLAALQLFRPGAVKFAYPFELDAETRLHKKGLRVKGAGDEFADQRQRLLTLAAERFEQAMQRDQAYATACVNLAAVTSLMGDNDSAVILANKGMALARKGEEPATLADALVARGIAYAAGGNREKAAADFAAAGRSDSGSGLANLALLEGGAAPKLRRGEGEAAPAARETIGGASSDDGFVKGKDVVTFSLRGVEQGEPTITVYARQSEGWEDDLIVADGRYTRVLAAGKRYGGRSARGIANGSPLQEVRRQYGEPSQIVNARQGSYYQYCKSGMVFFIDSGLKVSG